MKNILFKILLVFSLGLFPLSPFCRAADSPQSKPSAESGKFEEAGHEMKEGFQTTGHEVKKGSKKAGHEIKKGGETAGRGFKKAGHEIHDTFTK